MRYAAQIVGKGYLGGIAELIENEQPYLRRHECHYGLVVGEKLRQGVSEEVKHHTCQHCTCQNNHITRMCHLANACGVARAEVVRHLYRSRRAEAVIYHKSELPYGGEHLHGCHGVGAEPSGEYRCRGEDGCLHAYLHRYGQRSDGDEAQL